MAKRATTKTATKKPASRARGITKASDDRVHRRLLRRAKKAPADVKPARVQHGWTDDRDRQLRTQFSVNPRHAIAAFSRQFGVKRGEVKRRARQLGLLPEKGAIAALAKSAPEPLCSFGNPTRSDWKDPDYDGPHHCGKCAAESERLAASAEEQPAKREKKPITVTCPRGDERLEILHKGRRRGFTIIGGAAPEKIYGAGPNGLPICPTHDVEMIPAGAVEVAEAFRQVAAATAPPLQSALFDTAREFNADGAMVALNGLRESIVALREVVASETRELAKHRKDLDTLEESLLSGLEDFMKRRAAKKAMVADAQERAQVRENAICSFERHVGKDCPLCHAFSRALAVANIEAPITAYTDVTSDAHSAAAAKANSIDPDRLIQMTPAIVARALELAGLYGVTADDLWTWTEGAQLEALRWLESDRTETPPDVVGVPHRAAAAGAEAQSCADCGAMLAQFRPDENGVRLGLAFPEGALVGIHCTRSIDEPQETPAQEAHAHA